MNHNIIFLLQKFEKFHFKSSISSYLICLKMILLHTFFAGTCRVDLVERI